MRFAMFPVHLSKLLRLPRKSDARSYEVLHQAISSQQTWKSEAPKCNPSQEISAPDPLTALMNMSLALRLPRKMHLCRSSSNVPCLPSLLGMLQNPHVLSTFGKVHNPLRLPCETTSERPKVARACGAFCILTSKCAWRHNSVHFFDIATFEPEVPLAFSQRRALFRHRNCQKWPGPGVLCTFWLRNVLRATTGCPF